jgi:Na+/phosphate symporter
VSLRAGLGRIMGASVGCSVLLAAVGCSSKMVSPLSLRAGVLIAGRLVSRGDVTGLPRLEPWEE